MSSQFKREFSEHKGSTEPTGYLVGAHLVNLEWNKTVISYDALLWLLTIQDIMVLAIDSTAVSRFK